LYTIRQAAALSGVPAALLRAWERRYGVVTPRRTPSGYRLYDDAAVEQLQAMRRLVDAGWSASTAAEAVKSGEPLPEAARGDVRPEVGGVPDPTSLVPQRSRELIAALVDAAVALEAERTEAALDDIFAVGSFERIADELLLPALVAIGEAWADGRISVAGEHAASHAVQRRLAAAFQAAGRPGLRNGSVLVGMPPGGRHELGALSFAIAARRANFPVLYLGPDLPLQDWVDTARAVRARAVVIGAVVATDAPAAAAVARALDAAVPGLTIVFGGAAAAAAGEGLELERSAMVLPDGIADSVERVRTALGRRR
jgi:DNA-binding transcriptional MerR regulator